MNKTISTYRQRPTLKKVPSFFYIFCYSCPKHFEKTMQGCIDCFPASIDLPTLPFVTHIIVSTL